MSTLRASIVVLVALFALGGVFGCEKEGPAEWTGEKIDLSMEKVQKQTEETMEQAQEQTEEATEATGVTLEEAEKEVKEATK